MTEPIRWPHATDADLAFVCDIMEVKPSNRVAIMARARLKREKYSG